MKTSSLLLSFCVCLTAFTACTNSTGFDTPRSASSSQRFLTTPVSGTSGTVSQAPTAPPIIRSFALLTSQGSEITANLTLIILGQNFIGTSQVLWNNSTAAFVVISDSQINVAQQSLAITRSTITITNVLGSTSAIIPFPPFTSFNSTSPPTIVNIAPTLVARGGAVTITGTNFREVREVRFGNISATSFTVVSETILTAVVPLNAISDEIWITTTGGTAFFRGLAILQPPILSVCAPSSARSGTTVSLAGRGFTGTTSVRFGGINAASFIIISDTRIDAVVGSGATGQITISTPGGIASLEGFTFVLVPTITSFTPTSAPSGAVITINGTNFTGATQVQFGGVNARSFTVVSPTQITATVGTGATGNVSVTTQGDRTVLAGFIFQP